jgi:hypothetical protein
MGQQPNVPLEIEDLPRRTPKPAAARRWAPNRPGDLTEPGDVPWGGSFGTPGPDGGYALLLVRRREVTPAPGESRADLEQAIAALMVARGSRLGRAPVDADADVAEALLGVGGDPSWRRPLIAGLAHKPWRAPRLVEAVDPDLLLADPDTVRSALSDREHPVEDGG